MRVLMLGWEFPPHISGGLGTACRGLTRGLERLGVEVLFVVPRAYGDEDGGGARVVGADQIPVPEGAHDPRRSAGASAGAASEHAGGGFELRAVDSPLRPYLDCASYAARVRTQSRPPGGPGGPPAEAGGRLRLMQRSDSYGTDLLEEVGRYARAVGALAARERFDVIHAHDWMSLPAGLAARDASARPLVFHVHACESDRAGAHPDPRVEAIEQLGLELADRVVCVSRYAAGVLRRTYSFDESRLRVVHNGLTRAAPRPGPPGARPFPEPIVLFLGRVTSQKGPDTFLEAAALVARVRPDVKFVVAGCGDLLPATIERCAGMGLARSVHFTGFLRGEEVGRMYALATVYVMPSVSEPFGIAPLEALSQDVPVIVSRQSGVSEVLPSALQFDHWDAAGLAGQVLAVLESPALRESLVRRGRSELQRLHWEVAARKLCDCYAELAGGA